MLLSQGTATTDSFCCLAVTWANPLYHLAVPWCWQPPHHLVAVHVKASLHCLATVCTKSRSWPLARCHQPLLYSDSSPLITCCNFHFSQYLTHLINLRAGVSNIWPMGWIWPTELLCPASQTTGEPKDLEVCLAVDEACHSGPGGHGHG